MSERIDIQNSSVNPFTPGFGQVPAYIAGRAYMLNDIKQALVSPGFSPDLTTLFVGARGSGKTAMLAYVSEFASSIGWVSVGVSARKGMLEEIIETVNYQAEHLLCNKPAARLKSMNMGGVGLAWDNAPIEKGGWRVRMNAVFDQLEETETGLLITVDEVNPSVEEFIQLVSTYQHFVREKRRVALMMAGLPALASALLANEYVSFLRRAQYRKLGRIEDCEVANAFRSTVESSGRIVGDEALGVAVRAIDGFAYMLQLVGFQAWRRSPDKHEVSSEDVEHGVEIARLEVKTKVLETTYAELSQGDRRFVNAMLDAQGPCTLADVSRIMGVKSNYASKYKKRLMEAGVVRETLMKELRFDLPMFEEYAREVRE